MKIREVSEEFNLSTDTLRYYEKIGLIPKVKRNNTGICIYNEGDLKMIEFIKCMRTAGLSIDILRKLRREKKILQAQRDKFKEKINMMQITLARLNKKIESYDNAFFQIKNESMT